MKISDLKQSTNEGFMDTLKSFVPGSAENTARKNDKQTQNAYKIGLKDFTNKINGALKTAISSGAVSMPQAQAAAGAAGAAAPAAAPVNYDIPTAQRNAQAAQQGQAGQTQAGAQPSQPGQPPKPATAPKTPTTPQAPSTDTNGAEPIDVSPGMRIELHDKSDRQLNYYKTDKGWFNAANERVSKPSSVQYLDQQANAKGGEKFTASEVKIPPQPASVTKNGRSADAQANRQAQLNKKNQQRGGAKNESYRQLNWLLENRILREQNEDTISSFVGNFITGQTSKFPQNPAYVKRAQALANQAESEYLKTKGISPELGKQMWDLIWSWSQIGGTSNGQGQGQAQDQDSQDSGDQQNNNSEEEEYEQLDSRATRDLYRTGQFLKKAAKDTSLLKSSKTQEFRDQIVNLAKKFGG